MTNRDDCPYENTLRDLRGCYEALTFIDTAHPSLDEHKAMVKLVSLCKRIAEEHGDVLETWKEGE